MSESNLRVFLACTTSLCLSLPATAQSFPAAPDHGKLLATGGVATVEAAGGGGLSPWALISGYGSEDSYGITAHVSTLRTQDYQLKTGGIALGIADKLELSLGQQQLSGSRAPLDQLVLAQDIVGIKLKLSGDPVADQDRWQPQIAIGALYKHDHRLAGLAALGVDNVRQLGAVDTHGIDYYLAASKLLLANSLLLNGTIRLSKANQMGLLGFGGDLHDRYQIMPEVSLAYLLERHWVGGIEYRAKPRNLSVDQEKAYYDAFLAWFPNKHVSLTLAYVTLGDITIFNPAKQRGWYLSLQTGY
ncbi:MULTISPECIES: DUF3034 family protein [unclassified Undibacterium]|uniref:DUF3034 family protein n=1 Tax=unclassified Undibacterium TaxID=2630295 RepID=UPI002AC96491|nr:MULTISPECIES: DUF3034 family protein [unclassified Undibacterium]MEB0140621.1 DUF3034 family protein [Undibacterium sp. CCC2.1]MEB0173473.1 DUF3034 family protein [Undibacterium sp. CCC1.1]MEB0177625.1 DUF3034 family protein [Undibacterium sp. CCC3.4]MEB0216799.1 DUF3034 family protein [Undibacterium sp. 5I2]WPX44651.1 DUF3034 family protein [Undibacterium sp. CCC3.4]